MSLPVSIPQLSDIKLYEVLRRVITLAVDGTKKVLFVDEKNGVVGVNTQSPRTGEFKLDVAGGDIGVQGAGYGLVLKTPDGTATYRVFMDNTGALATVRLTAAALFMLAASAGAVPVVGSTTTYGSASASATTLISSGTSVMLATHSITFDSLPASATVRWSMVYTKDATAGRVFLRFNGDASTANYDSGGQVTNAAGGLSAQAGNSAAGFGDRCFLSRNQTYSMYAGTTASADGFFSVGPTTTTLIGGQTWSMIDDFTGGGQTPAYGITLCQYRGSSAISSMQVVTSASSSTISWLLERVR